MYLHMKPQDFIDASVRQVATITASCAKVPGGASSAGRPTPSCRVSACGAAAKTTSWTPPPDTANVRADARWPWCDWV